MLEELGPQSVDAFPLVAGISQLVVDSEFSTQGWAAGLPYIYGMYAASLGLAAVRECARNQDSW